MAEQYYSPSDIASACDVTQRQAQNIIRSVLGQRTRYRLTQDEYKRVRNWHKKFGKRAKSKNHFRFTSD